MQGFFGLNELQSSQIISGSQGQVSKICLRDAEINSA